MCSGYVILATCWLLQGWAEGRVVVREPRAGAAAARTTRCSAPSVAAPANMLPPSFPAPGKHILGVVFFSLFRIRFRNTAFLPGWQIILPEPIVGFGSVAKPILFRSAPTFGSTCTYCSTKLYKIRH